MRPADRRLIAAATEARTEAYAPYSHFLVGAAVQAAPALAGAATSRRRGRIYRGCNVENASYGLTICAERVAVFAAIAAGERHLTAIAVVTDTPTPTPPCGACRQVLHEFGPDLVVISATLDGAVATHPLSDLLPVAFGPNQLSDRL
jgi:cytidine deaminase